MADLADFVLEIVSAPGTATFSLGGPPAGRLAFSSEFLTGASPFYFAVSTDGTQFEGGVGTLTVGSPDLLARTVVTSNSLNTTAHIDFQGQVYVYSQIPAAYSLYISALGGFTPPNLASIALQSNSTVTINASSDTSLFANGTMALTAATVTLAGNVILNGGTTTPVVFKKSGTEIARFNGGSFAIGCTTDSPNTPAVTNGFVIRPPGFSGALVSTYRATGDFFELGTASFGNAMIFLSGGSNVGSIAIGPSATVFNTTSDYRIKIKIHPLIGALERVSKLPLIRHGWAGRESAPSVDGAFAHDVAAMVPEAVAGEKDAIDADGKPILQMVDWSKCMPVTLAAIQELHELVRAQGELIRFLLAGRTDLG